MEKYNDVMRDYETFCKDNNVEIIDADELWLHYFLIDDIRYVKVNEFIARFTNAQ